MCLRTPPGNVVEVDKHTSLSSDAQVVILYGPFRLAPLNQHKAVFSFTAMHSRGIL